MASIPPITSKVPIEVRRPLEAIRQELLRIGKSTGVGSQGSGGAGAGSNVGSNGTGKGTGGGIGGGTGTGGGTGGGTGTVVIPPAITGFVATGAFAAILLEWNQPHSAGYAYTEIYRATVDDIGISVLIGSSIAPIFSDIPPNSATSITYYYWVRGVNSLGDKGPFNATAGMPASTATDPQYALDILSGKIKATQLFTDLNTRINLIDNPGTGLIDTQALHEIKQIQLIDNSNLSADALLANAIASHDNIKGHLANKGNVATITNATNIIQSDLLSEVTSRLQLEAKLNASTALYSTSSTAAADALKAVAGDTATMQAQINGNTASIQTEQKTRTDAVKAQAIRTDTLVAELASPDGSIQSAIAQETVSTLATADSAAASRVSTLQTTVNGNTASIQTEQTARSTADSATATKVDTLLSGDIASANAILSQALSGHSTMESGFSNVASIQTEQKTRTDAVKAQAIRTDTLVAGLASPDGSIQSAIAQETVSTLATADSAAASRVSTLQTTVNGNTASIQTEQKTRTDAVKAQAIRTDTLVAGLASPDGSIQSAIAQETVSTLATADSAAASRVSTLQTTVNGNTASIQTQAQSINGLQAEYTVKLDVNGHVSGFGLSSGPETSDFIVRADRFSVTGGAGKLVPFVIDAATGITHIEGALIKDATITNAKIKFLDGDTINAAIKITSPLITGGTIEVGGATGINTGTGVYIGSANNGLFRAGNPSGSHIKWDGAGVSVQGTIKDVSGNPVDNTQTVIDGGIITTNKIELGEGGSIRSGQQSYDNGNGFWLGKSGGITKLSIGNSSGDKIIWDGSTLSIAGGLAKVITADIATTYLDTPFFATLGYNNAAYFHILDITVWDSGTAYLQVSGWNPLNNGIAGGTVILKHNGVIIATVSASNGYPADTPWVLRNITLGDVISAYGSGEGGGQVNSSGSLNIHAKSGAKVTSRTF